MGGIGGAQSLNKQGIASGNPNDYITEDRRLAGDLLPGQSIGGTSFANADPRRMTQGLSIQDPTLVQSEIRFDVDPLTGKKVSSLFQVKSQNTRKGETVFKESF